MNVVFPQAGIITSINSNEGKALIPLLQQETDWCPIAKHLFTGDEPIAVGDEVLVVFLNGDAHSPAISAKL